MKKRLMGAKAAGQAFLSNYICIYKKTLAYFLHENGLKTYPAEID
jgi:hypothetical protein